MRSLYLGLMLCIPVLGQPFYSVRRIAGKEPSTAPALVGEVWLRDPISVAPGNGGVLAIADGDPVTNIQDYVSYLRFAGSDGIVRTFPADQFARYQPYRLASDGRGGAIVFVDPHRQGLSAESSIWRFHTDSTLQRINDGRRGPRYDVPLADAAFVQVVAVAAGPGGRLFIADNQGGKNGCVILREDSNGIVRVVAGGNSGGLTYDLLNYSGSATYPKLSEISAMDYDARGETLYFIRGGTNGPVVSALSQNGVMSYLGGAVDGAQGTVGGALPVQGVAASSLFFGSGRPQTTLYKGKLLVSAGCRIYQISASVAKEFAGGECGWAPDGSTLSAARFGTITHLTTQGDNLIVAGSGQVRRIDDSGILSTAAGRRHFGGEGGPASEALFDNPGPLVFDPNGNLLIADRGNGLIRSIMTDGTTRTVFSGVPAFFQMARDSDGTLVGTDKSRVLRVASPNRVTQIAQLYATGVAVHPVTRSIFAITAYPTPTIWQMGSDGTPKPFAFDNGEGSLSFDKAGNLYSLGWVSGQLRRYTSDGQYTLLNKVALGQVHTLESDTSLLAAGGNNDLNRVVFGGAVTKVATVPNLAGIGSASNGSIVVSSLDGVFRFSVDSIANLEIKLDPVITFKGTVRRTVRAVVSASSGAPLSRVPIQYRIEGKTARISPFRFDPDLAFDYTTDFRGVSMANILIDDPFADVVLSVSVPGLPSQSVTAYRGAPRLTPEIDSIDPSAPRSFAVVHGKSFVPPGKEASAAEDQDLPQSLAGVCVWIGDELGRIRRITPTSIEVQVPSTASADVSVSVVLDCGQTTEAVGTPMIANFPATKPEWLTWPSPQLELGVPVQAWDHLNGSPLGPPDMLPGIGVFPIRAGDTIDLFATGIGLADAGSDSPTVVIGSVELNDRIVISEVTPGTYRIQLRVPEDVPAGDLPLSLRVGRTISTAKVFLRINK